MEHNNQPSAWNDFDEITEVLTLPTMKLKSGEPARIKIRAVPSDEIGPQIKHLPIEPTGDTTPTRSLATVVDRILELASPSYEIARLGCVNPQVWDGSKAEDGRIPWRWIPFEDQSFIVSRVLRLSGWQSEETRELRTFPDGGDRGGPDSTGLDRPVSAEPSAVGNADPAPLDVGASA